MPADFEVPRLLGATRAALASGDQLMQWWRTQNRGESLPTFPLVRPSRSLVEMSGFYSRTADGETPVMGCLQRARLGVPSSNSVFDSLKSLPGQFASLCAWTRPDGGRGGFTYTPLLRQRTGVETPEPASPEEAVDFGLQELDWLVARVDIHDFARAIPLLAPISGMASRFVREAAMVVVHRNYRSRTDCRGQAQGCCFGYSFLPLAPEPSPFGFGPGHFGGAIKLFEFTRSEEGALEVSLAFIVSPRSEKVLDLAGFDPVYSTIELLDRLTFRGLRLSRRAHDRLDAVMLRLHGVVHHRLLTEMAQRWAEPGADT